MNCKVTELFDFFADHVRKGLRDGFREMARETRGAAFFGPHGRSTPTGAACATADDSAHDIACRPCDNSGDAWHRAFAPNNLHRNTDMGRFTRRTFRDWRNPKGIPKPARHPGLDRKRVAHSRDVHLADLILAAIQTFNSATVRCLAPLLLAAFMLLSGATSAADKIAVPDAVWQRIQKGDSGLAILDYWNVCGIKYRTRIYKDLFTCLDRVEERVFREAQSFRSGNAPRAKPSISDYSQLTDTATNRVEDSVETLEKFVPFYTNWMRAEAFVELGQLQEARESAKAALKVVSPTPDVRRMNWACIEFGGFFPFGSQNTGLICRNNPAGVDFDYQVIRMRLLAQMGLVNALLGDTQEAENYVAEIGRMFNLRGARPYGTMARLQATIPLFALKKYDEVARIHQEVRDTSEYRVLTGKEVVKSQYHHMGNLPDLSRGQNIWLSVLGQLAFSLIAHLGDHQEFETGLDGASSSYMYATSLSQLGRTAEAKKILDQMLADAEIQNMGSIFWNVAYERGQISLKDGNRDEGIKYFRQSVDAIERVRTSISFETSKIGFAGNKQAVYGALVAALAEEGNWTGAFEAMERAKARALVDLLAEKSNLAPPDDANEKIVQLLAQASTSDAAMAAGVEAIKRHGTTLAAREQLGKMAPEVASLISVRTVQLGEIADRLGAKETLLDYYQAGQDLYVAVVNSNSVRGFKLSADGLESEVRRFRAELQAANPKALQTAKVLYDRLLRPLAGELKGNVLTITPHGVLHYLPFAALSDGKKHLIDSYSLRVMPSANALAYLRTDKPVKPGKLLALGNPDLGDAKLDLPSAQREAVQVAGLYPASKALVRQAASKTAVKDFGNGFEILHIASHGHFDSDAPLKSGLLLAKGTEPNGSLTVEDLYSMRLDVDLVTLSACETGLGKVASGDDVVGLTRGFLYAGARTIVSSLWQVDDEATAKLMTSFYRNLQGFGKREALRLAQMEVRKAYPHPFYWAAFQVVGNG